jgi:hypothetical protein
MAFAGAVNFVGFGFWRNAPTVIDFLGAVTFVGFDFWRRAPESLIFGEESRGV